MKAVFQALPLALRKPVLRAMLHVPGKAQRFAFFRLEELTDKSALEAEAVAAFEARVAQLGPGSICIDAGANKGTVSDRLAATGAEVHAFEPDPWTFEKLSARVGGRANVHLYNKALGAEAGHLPFFRPPDWAENPEGKSEAVSVGERQRYQSAEPAGEVEVVDFFAFVQSLGRAVDLVKMDIEGSEFAILTRLLAEERPLPVAALFIETHARYDSAYVGALLAFQRGWPASRTPYINLNWP